MKFVINIGGCSTYGYDQKIHPQRKRRKHHKLQFANSQMRAMWQTDPGQDWSDQPCQKSYMVAAMVLSARIGGTTTCQTNKTACDLMYMYIPRPFVLYL